MEIQSRRWSERTQKKPVHSNFDEIRAVCVLGPAEVFRIFIAIFFFNVEMDVWSIENG